jgi:hypothetical protein
MSSSFLRTALRGYYAATKVADRASISSKSSATACVRKRGSPGNFVVLRLQARHDRQMLGVGERDVGPEPREQSDLRLSAAYR